MRFVPTFTDPTTGPDFFDTPEHQLDHAEQLIEALVQENEALRYALETKQAS